MNTNRSRARAALTFVLVALILGVVIVINVAYQTHAPCTDITWWLTGGRMPLRCLTD